MKKHHTAAMAAAILASALLGTAARADETANAASRPVSKSGIPYSSTAAVGA